jgi:1,4-alpha-glucan branching enzyme
MKALATVSKAHSVPGLFSVPLPDDFDSLRHVPAYPIEKQTEKKSMAKSNAKPRVNAKSTTTTNRVSQAASVDLKPEPFQLQAPRARSVKLAAAFTEWEKCPLDMIKGENGSWFIIVPLPPGEHHYRFIVDGQWQDDPQAARRVPNPFGGENAVHIVT